MKNKSLEIISLLKEQEFINFKLNNLLYGSIEIRERCHKKYIFVHYRQEKKIATKYAGEYSDYLIRLINDNSIQAKQMKSQLRKIKKELSELGFKDVELQPETQKVVDYYLEHEVELIRDLLAADKSKLTIEQVDAVLNSVPVNDVTSDLVIKIMNLKRAVEFMLAKFVLSHSSSFDVLLAINGFLEEGVIFSAGQLRTTPYITNGRYEAPGIPVEEVVREEIEGLLAENIDTVDSAIESLLYIIKNKLFLFGNKKTGLLYANHILISKGFGILTIPAEKADEFKKLYISYRDNKNESIKTFIKDNCLIKL